MAATRYVVIRWDAEDEGWYSAADTDDKTEALGFLLACRDHGETVAFVDTEELGADQ